MNVYEQQARALKEIAAELKGIRRALDIIGKSLKPGGDPLADALADAFARQEADQAVKQENEAETFICALTVTPCGECKQPDICPYRVREVADNG